MKPAAQLDTYFPRKAHSLARRYDGPCCRMRAGVKAGLSAALVAALACLAPLTAVAQTPPSEVFLSNEDNAVAGSIGVNSPSAGSVAQEFVTEPFFGGIVPRRVTLWFGSGTDANIDSSALTVGIWRNGMSTSGPLLSTGTPRGRYLVLTNPTNLGGPGEKVFTYGGLDDLGGNIRYHIVVQYSTLPGTSPLHIEYTTDASSTERADDWGINSPWQGEDGSWSLATDAVSGNPRYLRFKLEGFRKNSAATGEPAVIGVGQVGLTLTATPGDINDGNGANEDEFEYQWFRYEADSSVNEAIMLGGQPVTGPYYTITNTDLGKRIGVKVTFTDNDGYPEMLESGPATGAVIAATYTEHILYEGDAESGPVIAGTFMVGETITIDLNGVTDPDGKPPILDDSSSSVFLYAIDWGFPQPADEESFPDSSFVVTKTGDYTATFLLEHRQRNRFVMACWNYRTGGVIGERNIVCSRQYGPVQPYAGGRPVIDGRAEIGEILTALPGTIADTEGVPDESTFTYQWTRVWVDGSRSRDIPGATSRTYTLTPSDYNQNVAVEVSFDDLGGNPETRVSDPLPADSTMVLSRPPTSGPTLEGTFREGQDLSIDFSTIVDPEGLPSDPEWTFSFWHVPVATTLDDVVAANYESIPQGTRMQTGRNPAVKVEEGDRSIGGVGERKVIGIVSYTDSIGGRHTISTGFSNALAGPNRDAAGKPEIIGTARVGETLEAVTDPAAIAMDITDADGLPDEDTYTYQWEREIFLNFWSDIIGATESTYQLALADGDSKVRVIVSFIDGLHATESLTSDPYPSSGNVVPNVAATGEPEVTGAAEEGSTLLAVPGTIADIDGLERTTYTYAWYRQDADGTNRSASAIHTGDSYKLVADDAGKQIVVVASFTDEDDYAESRESAPYPEDGVILANIPATGKPAILGVASQGHTLRASLGAGADRIADVNGLSGATYTYAWYRQETDGTGRSASPISTAVSYRLIAADVGKQIVVVASFSDDNTNQESRESDPYPPPPVMITDNIPATGKPEIFGLANAGQTLTAATDPDQIADDIRDRDGSPAPSGYTYVWEREETGGNWLPISGATSSTYLLAQNDVGKRVRVELNFVDQFNNSESLTSDPFPPSGGVSANFLATGEPAVSGTAEEGLTLTAAPGSIDDPDMLTGVTYTYDWYRQDTDGTNRSASAIHTGNSYRLVAADAGKKIVAVARFMDVDGNAESRESVPYPTTGAVVANIPATGKPEIMGVASDGQTLMAAPGIPPDGVADGNGLSGVTYTYEWYRQDSDGSNRSQNPLHTGDSYMLMTADVGQQIVVIARFSDDNTNEERRDSDPYPPGGTVSANSPATGTPEIAGEASVGETLTAYTAPVDIVDDIADADGLPAAPAYTYQWMREDRDGGNPMDIPNATSPTYVLAEDDGGRKIRVRVSFTDSVGGAEARMSEAYPVSGTVSAPPVGLPAVSGTVAVGETLSVDTAGIMDPNGLTLVNYRYQWQRLDADGTNPVNLATTATYLVVSADARKRLRVMVGFADDDRNSHSLTSESTPPVNVPATGALAISGAARVGEALTASTEAIRDFNGILNATYAYQWQRAADATGIEDISDAILEDYTPTRAGDQGKFLRVKVTFTDDDGNTEILISGWTEEVAKRANLPPAGAPTISGMVQEGQTLTASATAISDVNGIVGENFTYQWQRQNAPRVWGNVGSGSTAYALTAADIGMRIRVQVLFTDEDGYPESVASDVTAPITSANNTLATGAPAVAGTAKVGQTLRATPGTIADADGLAGPGYAYQWQRGEPGAVIVWSDIAGAVASSSYTLRVADEGKKIRVKAVFMDDGDSLEERQSAAYPAGSGAVEPADASSGGDSGTSGSTGSVFTIDGPSGAITEPAAGSTLDLDFVVALARSASQTAATLTVDVSFADGSAREGRDFTYSGPQTLVFDEGVAERTIRVTVNSDIVAEPSGETLVIILANPSQGASLGATRSVTVTINEPSSQIYVEASEPLYTKEDRTVSFNIRLSNFSAPAPVAGQVWWRLVFGDAGVNTAAASARSVEGRATVTCTLSGCAGSAEFQAFGRTPMEPTSAVFDSDLPEGTVISLQVKPFAANPSGAPGSALPTGTVVAVKPSERLDDEAETVEDWVVAGKETLIRPYPGVLAHAVAGVGHSVATSIVGGIWRRAEARRPDGLESRVTLGGRVLDTQALSSEDASRTVREVASLLGIEATAPYGVTDRVDSGIGGGIDDYRAWAGIPDQNRLASQSGFAVSAGERPGRGHAAIWGEFSTATRKSDPEENSSVESETSNMLLGIDLPIGGETLYGLVYSRSSGESEYTDSLLDGTAESSLKTFAPYVLWTAETGSSLWGSVGRGSGTLKMTINSGEVETDAELTMLAAGAKTASSLAGGVEYSMRVDYFQTEMAVERVEGFNELSAEASRFRVALEGTAARTLGGGGASSSSLELGARMDSGDGEEGIGADIAVDLRYLSPGGGLELIGYTGVLLLHQQEGFSEWGAGLGISYTTGREGRGTRLSLEPTWNAPRTGVAETMWGAQNLDGYPSSNAGAAMKMRLGYGAGALRDRALVTMYGETDAGGDSRRLRLGVEMHGLAGPLERLSIDIYGEREEGQPSRPGDSIMLEGSLGF